MPELAPLRSHLGLGLVALLCLPACRAKQPLPRSIAAAWRESSEASPGARELGRVRLESDALTGTFRGACAVRRRPEPAARLQLFPDVGGKVLDLVADESGFRGYFPQAGRGLEHVWSEGPAPRHVLTFMAITLLERARGLDPSRAVDATREGDAWWIELAPAADGAEVTLEVTAEGDLARRHFAFRGASWTETVRPPGLRIEAKGFSLELSIERSQDEEELPGELFHLELPEGVTR